MHSADLFFTFNRRFLPSKYNSINSEDKINIFFLKNIPLVDEVQKIVERHQCTQEQSTIAMLEYENVIRKTYILDTANSGVIEVLKDIYFLFRKEFELVKEKIKENPTFLSNEQYCDNVHDLITNIEWILFYYTNVIAFSQMIQQFNINNFLSESHRQDWIEMCKAWGNKTPKDFRLILNINKNV
jgi:hypothetical protein